MKTNTNQVTQQQLDQLLVRLHPATRTSLSDAQAAGAELRQIARNAGWLGAVVSKETGSYLPEFLAHVCGR